MLVLPREVDYLGDLGLGHLESVDAADPDTVLVNVEHDPGSILAALGKEPLQYVDYEFHRRVIVVEKQDLVERGSLRLRAGFGDHFAFGRIGPEGRLVGHPKFASIQHPCDAWKHSANVQAHKMQFAVRRSRSGTQPSGPAQVPAHQRGDAGTRSTARGPIRRPTRKRAAVPASAAGAPGGARCRWPRSEPRSHRWSTGNATGYSHWAHRPGWGRRRCPRRATAPAAPAVQARRWPSATPPRAGDPRPSAVSAWAPAPLRAPSRPPRHRRW